MRRTQTINRLHAGRRRVGAFMAALLMVGLVVGMVPTTAGATTPTPVALLISQGAAFGYLGHSCGGIQEQSLTSGFAATTGYPTGAVYLRTSCGGSGRGGGYHTTPYTAWVGVTWDFTGAVISTTLLPGAPAGLDPTATYTDGSGNQVSNHLNAVNVLPPNCTVVNTTYCTYRAWLTLSPTFTPTPRVIAVAANTGPASGGTTVTVTGTGFTAATGVSFGGIGGTNVVVINDSTITAVSPPAGAGAVDVTVTSAGGTSAPVAGDTFTFVAAPTVSGVSPNGGTTLGGTDVTITGTGLTGATSVTFGGVPAGFWSTSDTSVTAISPATDNAGPVDIVVTTIGGASAVTSADQYTYAPDLAVTKVSPNYGPPAGGTAVTITGVNFVGVTEVDFGGTPTASFTVVSPTSITTISPPGSDSQDVTVIGPSGPSLATPQDLFSYGPAVSTITPTSGSSGGGTHVTIYGHNFQGASDVSFGQNSANSFTVNASGTAISAVAPPQSGTGPETVDVTVSGPDGTSPTVATDRFTYAAPAITLLTPTSGSAGGNTRVTISGRNFVGTTGVSFGGVPATSFTVAATGTSLSAITPPELGTGTTPVDVTVTTPAGSATQVGAYSYAAPIITKITPVAGAAGGSTTVVITGRNLYGASLVSFGGVAALGYADSPTGTSVTATTPPEAGSGPLAVDVSVTTAAGTGTLAGAFTYLAPTITKLNVVAGSGAGGTAVTITGLDMLGTTGVTFDGNAAVITKVTATTVTVTTPPGAGIVAVGVTSAAGTGTLANAFTYRTPTVTHISPATGAPAGGTKVTITGLYFTGASAVSFGGLAAASFTVTGPTTIVAYSPPGTGTVDITVTNPAGASATTIVDQFTY